jgi:hypothetical protein
VTQSFGRKDSIRCINTEENYKGVYVILTQKTTQTFQIMIYKAVSQLLAYRDSNELVEYLLTTYSVFNERQWFTKSNHDIKLEMLTYLANSLHRIGKHEESIFYAKQLGENIYFVL